MAPSEVAQWLEHQAINLTVAGSNPATHQLVKTNTPRRESVHHEAGGHSVALPNRLTGVSDLGRQMSAWQHDGFALQVCRRIIEQHRSKLKTRFDR
ncbi:hypothetical protein NHH03_04500 [Stieleria sp. TO1_6]|uniref:hypothetical protein n=1 Tax=Stieleria tagensis TaxID=2956795 RepID=UPI00209A745B|nr:hypothetical protein [Stieleria tagensis]MCO8120988.1 hypothetical protein [Stieleria tagensis]